MLASAAVPVLTSAVNSSIIYAGSMAHKEQKDKLKGTTEHQEEVNKIAKERQQEVEKTLDETKDVFQTKQLRVGEDDSLSVFNDTNDGSTYIRPGKQNAKILIGDENTNSISLGATGAHIDLGGRSHFNHPDGNTYLRSSRADQNVNIGGDGTRDINILPDAQGTFTAAGAFIANKDGTRIRGRGKDKIIDIGDTNTNNIRLAPSGGKNVRVGPKTWLDTTAGDMFLRTSKPNSKIKIGDVHTGGGVDIANNSLFVQKGAVNANKRFHANSGLTVKNGLNTNQICIDNKCLNPSHVDKINNSASHSALNTAKSQLNQRIDANVTDIGTLKTGGNLRGSQITNLTGGLDSANQNITNLQNSVTALEAKPPHPFGNDIKIGRSLFNHSSQNLYLRSGKKGKNVYIGDNFDTNHVEIGRGGAVTTTHKHVRHNKPTYFNHDAHFQKPVHVNDQMNINKKICFGNDVCLSRSDVENIQKNMTPDQIQKVKDSLTQEDIDKLTAGIASDVTDLKAFRDMAKNMVKANGELCLGGRCIKSFNEITPATVTKNSILGNDHRLGPHSVFNAGNGHTYIRSAKEGGQVRIGDIWTNNGTDIGLGALHVKRNVVNLNKPTNVNEQMNIHKKICVQGTCFEKAEADMLKRITEDPTSLQAQYEKADLGNSQFNQNGNVHINTKGDGHKIISIGNDGKAGAVHLGKRKGVAGQSTYVTVGESVFDGNNGETIIRSGKPGGNIRIRDDLGEQYGIFVGKDQINIAQGGLKINKHGDMILEAKNNKPIWVGHGKGKTREVVIGGGGNTPKLSVPGKLHVGGGNQFCLNGHCISGEQLRDMRDWRHTLPTKEQILGNDHKLGHHSYLNHSSGHSYVRARGNDKNVYVGDAHTNSVALGPGVGIIADKDRVYLRKQTVVEHPASFQQGANVTGKLDVSDNICINGECFNKDQLKIMKEGGSGNQTAAVVPTKDSILGADHKVGWHSYLKHSNGNVYIRAKDNSKNVNIGDAYTNNVNIGKDNAIEVKRSGHIDTHKPFWFNQKATLKSNHPLCFRTDANNANKQELCINRGDVHKLKNLETQSTPTKDSILGADHKVGWHTHLKHPSGTVYIRAKDDKSDIKIGDGWTRNVNIGKGNPLEVKSNRVIIKQPMDVHKEINTMKHLCVRHPTAHNNWRCLNYDDINKLKAVALNPSKAQVLGADHKLGTDTFFNHISGNAYIRPSKDGARIYIGDAKNTAGIDFGPLTSEGHSVTINNSSVQLNRNTNVTGSIIAKNEIKSQDKICAGNKCLNEGQIDKLAKVANQLTVNGDGSEIVYRKGDSDGELIVRTDGVKVAKNFIVGSRKNYGAKNKDDLQGMLCLGGNCITGGDMTELRKVVNPNTHYWNWRTPNALRGYFG